MKKLIVTLVLVLFVGLGLSACGNEDRYPEGFEIVEPRVVYEFAYVTVNDVENDVLASEFAGANIRFIGELEGGTVIFELPHDDHFDRVIAQTNPSREHPSFESGYWHHHLYAGSFEAGSPRISFYEGFPHLGIDFNAEAAQDNTQSAYQHGNLHYVVETGEYRLRFTINGDIVDLFFVEQ